MICRTHTRTEDDKPYISPNQPSTNRSTGERKCKHQSAEKIARLESSVDPEHEFDLDKVSVKYVKSVEIQTHNDDVPSWITGIAITEVGKKLLADRNNCKIKLFTQDYRHLSSLSLPQRPWALCNCRRDDVAISTLSSNIYIVAFVNDSLAVRQTLTLEYSVSGITICAGLIFVIAARPDGGQSVKMIDLSGHIYWTTPIDSTGLQTSSNSYHITSFRTFIGGNNDGYYARRLVVTSYQSRNVLLLDGETGEILKSAKTKVDGIRGVTVDRNSNVYIGGAASDALAICVMSGSVSNERTFTCMTEHKSLQEISNTHSDWPQGIAFDNTCKQIVMSRSAEKNVELLHIYAVHTDENDRS